VPNESPIKGYKAVETPSISDGLGFMSFPNGFHFVKVNRDTLSRHNKP